MARVAPVLLLAALCFAFASVHCEDCSTFDGDNGCQGDQTAQFSYMAKRRWQTPERDTAVWEPAYQDYRSIVGYTDLTYSADLKNATLRVNTFVRSEDATLTYYFNGKPQSSPILQVASGTVGPMSVAVKTSDGDTLALEDVDFHWDAPDVNQGPEYKGGQKGAVIELFGWPFKEVEEECPAIGKMGYMGVKVFPASESVLTYEWLQNGELNPWWFLYQPVSYRLHSRMGTREQLRSMIRACRRAGVRVYADAVINHMSGGGNDVGPHRHDSGGYCAWWGGKNSTDGSPYYTQDFNYELNNFTQQRPGEEYPAVPYGPMDFHCERPLNSWSSPFDLNFGWLTGLSDLATETDYVRERIAAYMVDLLSIGFSGFRIDAAKHVCPDDLAAILSKLRAKMGGALPGDFLTYLEVLIGGEKDLLECQYSSYNYAAYFADAMKKAGLSDADVGKVKIWESDYPKEFPICGSWVIPSERFAAENDCHDDQTPGSSSRDMGDKGSVLVIEKNVPKHRGFEKLLFDRTDGDWQLKLVLSSYTFMDNGAQGFPDGLSDCKLCTGPPHRCDGCKTVPYTKAHDDSVCGYTVYDDSGNWKEGAYTRVHRDKTVILAMRQWMGLPTDLPNKDLGLPDSCQAL